MAYTHISCMENFTDGQFRRMHNYCLTDPLLNKVVTVYNLNWFSCGGGGSSSLKAIIKTEELDFRVFPIYGLLALEISSATHTPTQPFFPLYCMSQGCEISSHIVCFHESNQLKFLNPYYESCDSLISTNTKDIISKTDVKLYPSLASHQLTIENSNISNLRIDITNSLGQLFISKQLDIGANTIDITSLTSGIYFALMTDGHKRRIDKFVKN